MTGYFSDKEPRELKDRVIYATSVVVLFSVALLGRIWYLQVMEHQHFKELSLNNRIRLVDVPAPRGLIYDRNGVRLAENRPGFDLAIVPEDVQDWPMTKSMLTKLVGMEPDKVDSILRKASGRAPFRAVKLKKDLSWEEMARIESFKHRLPGVVLEVGPKRTYPFGEATAHLVGYLGEISDKEFRKIKQEGGAEYSPGDLIGKYGIDRAFERFLRGTKGRRQVEVDALGREIRTLKEVAPYPGDNIRLTIDIKTQLAAWKAMKGKAGAVVAMDPKSGRILAMVSTPAFDPNRLTSGMTKAQWDRIIGNPLKVLTNRALQGQYPPASLFKIITAAAALEDGVIAPDTTIYSGPAFHFGGRDYRDWRELGHGLINIHRAIVESSDTFFYQVGLMVGIDRIARYAKGFGLGSRTDIALHNEKRGLVPTSAWKKKTLKEPWYEGETLSVAVGQGFLLATPLQMLVAYSAIANGGTIYRPQIVESIETPEGRTIKRFRAEAKGRLPLSQRTIDILKKALIGVVHEEGGTASVLSESTLRIAGKTGTAQVVRAEQRSRDVEKVPYRLRDHAWFVGYAPYDDPKIAVAVVVEHGGFGSRAAAPVALEVFRAYLEGDKEDGPEKAGGQVPADKTEPET